MQHQSIVYCEAIRIHYKGPHSNVHKNIIVLKLKKALFFSFLVVQTNNPKLFISSPSKLCFKHLYNYVYTHVHHTHHGLTIEARHRNQPNKSKLMLCKP